jgi:hypothetical protein
MLPTISPKTQGLNPGGDEIGARLIAGGRLTGTRLSLRLLDDLIRQHA